MVFDSQLKCTEFDPQQAFLNNNSQPYLLLNDIYLYSLLIKASLNDEIVHLCFCYLLCVSERPIFYAVR